MSQLPLADPALPPLLARGTVDRMSDRRTDGAWLDAAWARCGLVLELGADGTARVEGDALVLAPAAGPRPPDAWFLGADPGTEVAAAPAAPAVERKPWELDEPAAPGAAVDVAAGRGPSPATAADGAGGGGAAPAPGGEAAGAAYFGVLGDVAGGRNLREVGAGLNDRDAGLFATAVGLLHWHAGMQRCPRDGTPLETVTAGWVRRCPADGQQHFPRTDPAVIMLITSPDGEHAILGRQPVWPERMYSCLAGFVEPGESAEQAVVRESREEAALEVRDPRPVGSQPWPFPASLMLGFRAVADREVAPVSADGELADVRWFSRQEIRDGVVQVPPAASIANWIISGWLAER